MTAMKLFTNNQFPLAAILVVICKVSRIIFLHAKYFSAKHLLHCRSEIITQQSLISYRFAAGHVSLILIFVLLGTRISMACTQIQKKNLVPFNWSFLEKCQTILIAKKKKKKKKDRLSPTKYKKFSPEIKCYTWYTIHLK